MSNFASMSFFLPEIALSVVAILLLVVAMVPRRWLVAADGDVCCCGCFEVTTLLAAGGLLIAFWLQTGMWGVHVPGPFSGMLALDAPAWFFKAFVIVAAIFAVLFSRRSAELGTLPGGAAAPDAAEYHALIVGAVVGMCLLASATNLLMIYLALEFVGLCSYLLVGFAPGSVRSSEAAMKYVLFGAVASGVFLFGASLFFGTTGSLDITSLRVEEGALPLLLPAGILMLAGFLFKVAAVPMQAWCPDAYEGAPTPIAAFLSVAPKAAGFAVLMRVAAAFGDAAGWPTMIAVVAAATMTFGNLAAIPQQNVKRLLAYSSIAHAGYLLMGVACATRTGNEAVYFYLIAYLVMNLGAFLVVQIVGNRFGTESIDVFAGLVQRGPTGATVAIAMTVFLLSLTGIPPFAGFVGKFYLFKAVIEAKLLWLAIIGIVNSVISLYYYMRIVRAMFFDAPPDEGALPAEGGALPLLAVLLAAATLALGLAWGWFARFVALLS